MFKAITWGQYAGVVLLLLLLYYAYVGLVYYRVELLELFSGKGKAAGLDPASVALRSPTGRGSLIAKAASAVPAPLPEPEAAAPEVTQSAADEESQADEQAVGEGNPTEVFHPEEQLAQVVDLPAIDLPSVEVKSDSNYEIDTEISFINDNSINFTQQDGANSLQATESGMESAHDDFELGSTIGIAQLGDYLGRAAEGQVTQAQLVEQEPALANTDLLLAFFQDSAKNAQRATERLYAGVVEPAID